MQFKISFRFHERFKVTFISSQSFGVSRARRKTRIWLKCPRVGVERLK